MDPTTEEEFHRNLLMANARGHLQRAGATARAANPERGGDPAYSHHLLLEWCHGHKTAEKVNLEARLAWKSGARGGYLEDLKNLGAQGTQVGNCAKDLSQLVRRILGMAIIPVYIALMPLFVTKSLAEDARPQPELCPVGFLLPHVWMWFMFTYHRAEFFKRFVGCAEREASERLSSFWSNVHPADPRRGPLFDAVNFVTRCIPIGLHGDGVPCTKKDSLDVTSMFGILGVGTTSQLVCYLWSFFNKCKVGELTLLDFTSWVSGLTVDKGAEIILWSLLALETGLFPVTDHRGESFTQEPWVSLAGTSICGGFLGHLWQFRADADYHYNSIGLPGHWSSNHPCHSCDCTKIPNSLSNHLAFGPDVTWPNTIFVSMAAFFNHCTLMGKRVHPFLKPRAMGGLGLHVLIFLRDTLHCLDLGVSAAISGSVLWLLAYGNYVSDNPVEAISTVFTMINEMYSTEHTGCRFTNIDLNMFTDPDMPRGRNPWLKGKAAETRHLIPLLRVVWECFTKNTVYDKHVSQVLETLTETYSILGVRNDVGQVPQFMSAAASANFRAVVDLCLVHTSFLEQVALAEVPPSELFHMVSKFHSLWHCGWESQFSHPSCGRTYMNEDYMQHIRAIGLANRFAISSSRRSLTVAERVALGRSLQLFLTGP
jgi:hypothetical protein